MFRILYVEDHADTRDAICRLLTRAGYNVDAAANGREALDCAFAHRPDVLLLDMALPKMTGVELVRILRSYLRLSDIPIVVLSAFSDGPLIQGARAFHASAILLKSQSSFDQVLDAVREAIA